MLPSDTPSAITSVQLLNKDLAS